MAKLRPKTPKLAQKISQCATEFANLRYGDNGKPLPWGSGVWK